MKVLQNKLLILIVSSALIPVLVVMAIAFSNYGRIVENNSGQIMQHTYLYENSILSVENQSVENYRWNDTDKRLTAQKLRNGMTFTVCVTEQEIKQPQQKTLIDSILVILLIMSGFVAVTVLLTKAIVRLIYTDTLTQVGNKTAYNECVDLLCKRIRDKEQIDFLIAVVDINDLKTVNDTYGHEYGYGMCEEADFLV